MFDSKKENLFNANENREKKTSVIENPFIREGMKNSARTKSGNYAEKYSTTGNDFIDQFGKLSEYKKQRSFSEISKDMSVLWAKDKELAVKLTFFMRTITRKVSLFDGTKTNTVQRGGGLKHESIMRMLWIYQKNHNIFWKNIPLFISIGSWKDIFQMLSYDLQFHGWDGRVLEWNEIFELIASGLENQNTSDLVKKYLPQIKSNKSCTTVESQANNMIGKWIANKLFGSNDKASYVNYRKLKTSGDAHTWQQLISKGKFLEIDFNTVHGRALAQLVSSKFLENQGLEKKFEKWILSKPTAKFTGFVHELFKPYAISSFGYFSKLKLKRYQEYTIQKQFDGLVETAKKNAKTDTSLIVVRDTSASMLGSAHGYEDMACESIAKSLALFFSEMLPDGKFSNSWIEFNHDAKMHNWKGETVVEKWNNDETSTIGNTNFMSVIKLFCDIKRSGVNESEFPTGILCISDGEFDPSSLNETNVESTFKALRTAGFSDDYVDNFKIVLWNLRNNYYGDRSGTKFETYGGKDKNVFYFSGYEASIIAFLTGLEHQEKEPKNAEELFYAAMDQEVLNMIII